MANTIRTLLVPALFFAGWKLSAHNAEGTRRFTRGIAAIGAILWAVLAISGAVRLPSGLFAEDHKWLGHILFMIVWLAAPLTAGVFGQRGANLFAAIPLAIFMIGVTLLTELSGYLSPFHGEMRSVENVHRFYVLHCVAFPLAMAILIAWVIYRLRRRAESL